MRSESSIKILDLSLSSPAENLAMDEALLDHCDEGGGESLRFWENGSYFVVLGYSNRMEEEIHREACHAHGVGVFRRASGGGTILQGPGCLNYSLILRINPTGVIGRAPLKSVTDTNHYIMSRMRIALSKEFKRPVSVEGHTDLALGGLKFSGNAQRRKRSALLFHGTFLLGFDFEKIELFLKPPPRQPEYRAGRSHRNFLTNLDEDAGTIKSVIAEAWKADKEFTQIPREAMQRLAAEKYSQDSWNFKF